MELGAFACDLAHPMFAAVVRLDLLGSDPRLKITIQKYKAGQEMRDWGDA